MFKNGELYFAQTKHGESAWWSWGMVFWFLVVGGVFAQGIVGAPITEFAASSHPELYQKFTNQSMEMFSDQDLVIQVGIWTGSAALAAVATVIFWIINRVTKNTARTIFGVLTTITALATFYFGSKAFPLLNDANLNATLLEIIGANPWSYAFMLLTFPAMLVPLFLGQKFIHKRTITSLHTAAKKIKYNRFFVAIFITWIVYGISTALFHFTGLSPVKMSFEPGRFAIYALISLLFIPLQSGTEEIIFRGYLNQMFGHFIKHKWIVFIITSALFASMHLANPESVSGSEKGMAEHLMIMSGYFMFGFILSVIVWFEGGLEAAIGVHAANNMFAAIFVNYEGSVLPTPSLFLSGPPEGSDSWFIVVTLGVVAWLLYRSRKPITDIGNPVSV